jgi:hypothetical protein
MRFDAKHLAAAAVRRGHGEPRATPSKLQFLAALEHKFAMWRAILLHPRCVGKRGEVCSPLFASVCEPLHVSGLRLVFMKRPLVPSSYLRIIPMARMAQGPNAGGILPCDLETLAHNPLRNLVLAVGIPHAEAVLLFPRSEPVR